MEAVKASLAQDSLKAHRAPCRPRSSKETVFYQVISQHFAQFFKKLEDQSGDASMSLPDPIQAEFDAYLKCRILEHGFCPSCIGKWMNEGAAFFVANIILKVTVRQWVVSLPMPARFWMGYLVTRISEITSSIPSF